MAVSVNLAQKYTYINQMTEPWTKRINVNEHYLQLVGFQVFTAVTMKGAVFWDVVPCGFIIN
jgi:hypothetical protein